MGGMGGTCGCVLEEGLRGICIQCVLGGQGVGTEGGGGGMAGSHQHGLGVVGMASTASRHVSKPSANLDEGEGPGRECCGCVPATGAVTVLVVRQAWHCRMPVQLLRCQRSSPSQVSDPLVCPWLLLACMQAAADHPHGLQARERDAGRHTRAAQMADGGAHCTPAAAPAPRSRPHQLYQQRQQQPEQERQEEGAAEGQEGGGSSSGRSSSGSSRHGGGQQPCWRRRRRRSRGGRSS